MYYQPYPYYYNVNYYAPVYYHPYAFVPPPAYYYRPFVPMVYFP